MGNIKYYIPGNPITLFDANKHESLTGALIISSPDSLVSIQRNLMRMLAVLLLFISIFSLTISSLPLIDGVLSISNLFKKETQLKVERKDPNKYSDNFILKNELENQSQEFVITIPKIDVVSDVIANVDSTNEAIYKEQLMKGIAHANGSYLPGQNGPVFLFSHSTDILFNVEQFNAKFFALKDLEAEDEIIINYRGSIYKYAVKEKKIINPDDLEQIRNSNSDLILSTCFPPGTNWMRLIVFADLDIDI